MNGSIELRFCMSARNVPGINLNTLLTFGRMKLSRWTSRVATWRRRSGGCWRWSDGSWGSLRLIPGTFLADTQNLSSIERFINKLQTYCPLMLLSPALNPPSSLTFLHAHCGILCNQDKDCLNFLFEENSCILGGLQVPLLENDDEDISYFSVEPIGWTFLIKILLF